MNNNNIMLNERATKETRLIKSTSKRQITIPKSFFEILAIEDGVTFVAQVNENGIFLKPQSIMKQSIRDQDRSISFVKYFVKAIPKKRLLRN